MEKPLVSIIVPVYNAKNYISDCLQSILNQTYDNIEIILVDDGSIDGGGEVCDTFAIRDSRIRVVHQCNSGVSSARNHGIELCNGSRLCFVDSDDTIATNYIEELVKPLHEKDYDLIVCSLCDVFDNYNSRRIINNGLLTGNFKLDYYALKDLLFVPVVKLYKTSIIKENSLKFPIDVSFNEDQYFNMLYYGYVKEYKYIDNFLYYYFHRFNGSLTSKWNDEIFYGFLKKLEVERNFYRNNDVKKWPVIMNQHVISYIMMILSRNNYSYDDYKSKAELLREYAVFNGETINKKNEIALILLKLRMYRVIYCYAILKNMIVG